MHKLRVMVVDDSAFMRRFLGDIIQQDPQLVLAGTARNGEDALKKIDRLKPDVITLDLEMPKMDGLETLKRIMASSPRPVIMVSSLTREGSEATLEALASGAVDFVTKPSFPFTGEGQEDIKKSLPVKIKEAARARLLPRPAAAQAGEKTAAKILSDSFFQKISTGSGALLSDLRLVVAIAASTGGPRALEEVVKDFPRNFPGTVLITQHMPAGFTSSLAKRLDRVSGLRIKEAEAGDRLQPGTGFVAPGGYHLLVDKEGLLYLDSSPPVQHVRPSADVMMASVAGVFGSRAIGVVLTGMGRDGTDGMKAVKEKGGWTIVQEPSTAVIWSMPKSVIEAGYADEILPLSDIARAIQIFAGM